MRQDPIDTDALTYASCRYGQSRLWFRGPRKALDQPYLAFIGGTATYGKFIATPLPDLVEQALRLPCVNLGCVNGGIDAYVNDLQIMDICKASMATIVQVMGANNLSNRFYTVHPRRNDRFLCASPSLQSIYSHVDFAEFAFTRHLLGHLHAVSPEWFEVIVHELRLAWVARMQTMLRQIGPRSVLLWFSADPLDNAAWSASPRHLQADPLFITAAMIDTLRPLVRSVVVVHPSAAALAQGSTGMSVPQSQVAAASHMLGPACHKEAAAAVVSALMPLCATGLQTQKGPA